MLTGQERLVLEACDELAGHGYGFVLASDVAARTGMEFSAVSDCLLGLGRGEYVDLAPQENGSLKVSLTPKGRQELYLPVTVRGRLQAIPSEDRMGKVIPKGLLSYDEHDAEFFLDLLPGPRRGDGLPESIHFWKVRIAEKDPDRTFRVGLIYGPSGCGKSSLVKAGLLPRIADRVVPVYIPATSDSIELRLLEGLRKQCPDLPNDLDLAESISVLSEGRAIASGKKVLVVIDQFEQWMHANAAEENSELIAALRRCDGQHVLAIIMVRDDFWMATNRFESQVGVVFRRDHNSFGMDLFDKQHARMVLAAFGRAYGKLKDEPTSEQERFLDRAVDGLSQEGKVFPVRLALFAEMFRGREWSPRALMEVGGVGGIGVTFLEETFGTRHADPRYRRHREAVQPVLKALLPKGRSEIRCPIKSYDDLLNLSGYVWDSSKFDDLIRSLDTELHLVSPTAPEGENMSGSRPVEKNYQLTHDYLVPSIWDWLELKQNETRRGRTKLRLGELSSMWQSRKESRYYPTMWELIAFHVLTQKEERSEGENAFMNQASVRVRLMILLSILVGATTFGIAYYIYVDKFYKFDAEHPLSQPRPAEETYTLKKIQPGLSPPPPPSEPESTHP